MVEFGDGLIQNGLEQSLRRHDQQLEEFRGRLDRAQNAVGLRQAWTECPLVNSVAAYVSEGVHRTFWLTAIQTLERMGLDLSAPDDRILGLLNAIKAAAPGVDGFYYQGLHDPEMTALYRILSGSDPTQESGIKLRELTPLINMPMDIERPAMSFTEEDEYTVASRFPRKASRRVTDPYSPYWGFGVYTDTWPGTGSYNIYVYMPSGLATRDEIVRTEVGSNRDWLVNHPSNTPRTITVQSLHLGHRDPSSRQVDTSSGLVSGFVDGIRPPDGQDLYR